MRDPLSMSLSRLKLELCKESLLPCRPRRSRTGRTNSSARCGVFWGGLLASRFASLRFAPWQAVSPHLAAQGATELSGEEVRLADKLELSLVLELDWPSFQKLRDRKNALYEKQARLRWNAKKIVSGEEHPSQHLWVEQLLRQNADPSSLDRLGRTALMVAAFSGT